MTIRGGMKLLLSTIGVLLLLAFWRAGNSLESHGGLYLLALLMAVSGALPREVAILACISCAILLGNAALSGGEPLFGLGIGHALVCAGLSTANCFLAQASEIRVVRCIRCFWHGPTTDLHFGHCPKCRGNSLRDEHRTVMMHA